MHKRLRKHIKDLFGDPKNIPENLKEFMVVIDREFEYLDGRINATEKASDENILDLIISNVELSSYLNASRDLIFRINREDMIVDYVSNQDYLGLNLEQFKNRPVGELPLCDDAAFFSNALRQVRDLKLNLAIEYPVMINGEEIFLNARFMPILETDIVMVIRDITGEKKALKDLVRSEKNFRHLLEIMPYPVAVHKHLELVYVNEATIRLLGAEKADQLIGTNIRSYVHPDSQETVSRMSMEHDNGANELIAYRERLVDLRGNEYFVNLISCIISWGDDTAILIIGRNITDEIIMEERLVHAEEMYRLLTEKMSDAVWMIDQNEKILYINPVNKRLTGYDPEDYEKIPYDKIFSADSLVKLREHVAKLFSQQHSGPDGDKSGETVEMEVYKKGGGSIQVEVNLSLASFGKNNPVVIGVVRDITERKKIENELRKVENWRQLLLETTTDIIYTLDADGLFTYISPRVTEVTGHAPEEFMGKHFFDFVTAEEKADVMARFRAGIDEGLSQLYNITVVFDNGDRIPMEINVSTIHDRDGTPLGRLGVGRDIRSKIDTTGALAESERRYRMLAENLTDVVWTRNLSFENTYISPSTIKMSGFTPEEISRMSVTELFTPESVKNLYSVFAEEMEREREGTWDPDRSRTVEVQHYRKAGGIIESEIKMKFIRDALGRPTGILGVTRDITERKNAESALRKSEAKYRQVLNTMQEGYFEVDLKGNFISLNDTAYKLSGYSQGDLIGLNFRKFFNEKQAKQILDAFGRVFTTGIGIPLIRWEFILKNGNSMHIESSVNLLYDEFNRKIGFCGVMRDATERIMISEALRASEERLRLRNTVIEKDLETAQLIQKALMTESLPEFHDLKIECRYLPLDAVGGDYFSIKKLLEGGLSVFIGDVASHGVTAALYLSLIKATIDRLFRKFPLQPKLFVEKLNRDLFGNMPMSFLTAIYGVFTRNDKDGSMNLTFTSCGHPALIVYRSRGGKISFEQSKGTLIGMLEDIRASEKKIRLSKGDRVFLYTDGLPETMNRQREIWGFDRLPELFRKSMRPELGKTLDAVIEEINAFRGNMPFDDDIIILGFEV